MATKITILGKEPQKKVLQPIEFIKFLENGVKIVNNISSQPKDWDNIVLIKKNYSNGLDIMFASMDNSNDNCLFIGHFNDGVV